MMNEGEYRRAEARLWASVGLEPSERWIRMPTTGAVVRVQELGQGEPVLFIHGAPNAGSTWAPMLAHFDGFRSFLVDRPGTGLSKAYAFTDSNLAVVGATFVSDILDALRIDRAHVVASSFGGHLSLRSAAAHPERLQRMVLVGAPPLIEGQALPRLMRLLAFGLIRRLLNLAPPNERATRTTFRQLGHRAGLDAGRMPPAFIEWYTNLGRYTDTMWNDGEMIGQIVSREAALSLSSELLASVRTHTLLIWGEDDGVGGLDDARTLSSLLPESELVIVPEAGHLPWLDDPARVAEAAARFIKSNRVVPAEPQLHIEDSRTHSRAVAE
jgi:2-hydroxy-6-oxonona-2,4-dienedioate hydrolase